MAAEITRWLAAICLVLLIDTAAAEKECIQLKAQFGTFRTKKYWFGVTDNFYFEPKKIFTISTHSLFFPKKLPAGSPADLLLLYDTNTIIALSYMATHNQVPSAPANSPHRPSTHDHLQGPPNLSKPLAYIDTSSSAVGVEVVKANPPRKTTGSRQQYAVVIDHRATIDFSFFPKFSFRPFTVRRNYINIRFPVVIEGASANRYLGLRLYMGAKAVECPSVVPITTVEQIRNSWNLKWTLVVPSNHWNSIEDVINDRGDIKRFSQQHAGDTWLAEWRVIGNPLYQAVKINIQAPGIVPQKASYIDVVWVAVVDEPKPNKWGVRLYRRERLPETKKQSIVGEMHLDADRFSFIADTYDRYDTLTLRNDENAKTFRMYNGDYNPIIPDAPGPVPSPQ